MKRIPETRVHDEHSDWVAATSDKGEVSQSIRNARVEAVMTAAEERGLLKNKNGRIGGRVSPLLVARAKAETGIESDTDLIEFALANIALEDRFPETFKAVRGTVDPELKLSY